MIHIVYVGTHREPNMRLTFCGSKIVEFKFKQIHTAIQYLGFYKKRPRENIVFVCNVIF